VPALVVRVIVVTEVTDRIVYIIPLMLMAEPAAHHSWKCMPLAQVTVVPAVLTVPV
jgi:hypothetical protein